MKNKYCIYLLFIIYTIMNSMTAWALGIGVYFSGGYSYDKWETSTFHNSQKFSLEYLNKVIYGGGIILDTCAAKNEIFNYRLNVGIERYNIDPYKKTKPYDHIMKNDIDNLITLKNVKIQRLGIINTFGFGILKRKNFRLWIGPQLGLRYFWGSSHHLNIGFMYIMYPPNPGIYFFPYRGDLDFNNLFGIDIGAAIGCNFNFGKLLTASVEAGLREPIVIGGLKNLHTNKLHSQYNIFSYGIEANVSIAIMFRINDAYAKKT